LLVDNITATDALPVFATLVLLTFILYTQSGKSSSSPYPPGPRRLPFLGNLLQFPTGGFEWKEYDRMSKELGELQNVCFVSFILYNSS